MTSMSLKKKFFLDLFKTGLVELKHQPVHISVLGLTGPGRQAVLPMWGGTGADWARPGYSTHQQMPRQGSHGGLVQIITHSSYLNQGTFPVFQWSISNLDAIFATFCNFRISDTLCQKLSFSRKLEFISLSTVSLLGISSDSRRYPREVGCVHLMST